MKYRFIILCMLLCSSVLAQKKDANVYFPQEQLIHKKCNADETPNICLKNELLSITKPILEKAILFPNADPDTLKVRLTFSVDKNGDVLEDYAWSSINDSIMSKTWKDSLDFKLAQLPRFKVQNRKPKPYKPRHNFYFHFTKNEAKDQLQEIAVDSLLAYKGGDIFEAPIFKGCKRKTDDQNRRCFQQKMQEHISKNFKYPKKAYKKGIQGRVSIIFTIDKDGYASNIRTKGPAPILEEEAKRIIRLLPKSAPALKNGKAVKIPFSIPITFKLN